LTLHYSPRLVRRLTWLLFLGQSLGSAGFIAGSTVSALVGAALSGQAALAGVPAAVYLAGTAVAAYPAARLMERAGRRVGLSLGFGVGLLGAVIAGGSVLAGNFIMFLLGVMGMGAARGFNDLGRYAAAEMHPEAERGRAISLVVLGGTVGAVVGPALVGPTGDVAQRLGADSLAGAWFGSAGLFILGAGLISLFLRPDPRDLGRLVAGGAPAVATPASGPIRTWGEIIRAPDALTALAALVLGQVTMVMLMSMTSLHMQGHQHSLSDISLVISAHTLGMFGPSVISGRLADRWGRARVIVAGSLLLVASCLLAPVAHTPAVAAVMPQFHLAFAPLGLSAHITPDTVGMGVALLLLGLGWNFCYVAGGALLTDTLTVAERGRGQGSADLLINLASAFGSLGSGVIFATLGYALVNWVGLLIALAPLALAAGRLWPVRPAVASGSAEPTAGGLSD
jgi:MFS family permease